MRAIALQLRCRHVICHARTRTMDRRARTRFIHTPLLKTKRPARLQSDPLRCDVIMREALVPESPELTHSVCFTSLSTFLLFSVDTTLYTVYFCTNNIFLFRKKRQKTTTLCVCAALRAKRSRPDRVSGIESVQLSQHARPDDGSHTVTFMSPEGKILSCVRYLGAECGQFVHPLGS